jgi:hypothetical protein
MWVDQSHLRWLNMITREGKWWSSVVEWPWNSLSMKESDFHMCLMCYMISSKTGRVGFLLNGFVHKSHVPSSLLVILRANKILQYQYFREYPLEDTRTQEIAEKIGISKWLKVNSDTAFSNSNCSPTIKYDSLAKFSLRNKFYLLSVPCLPNL